MNIIDPLVELERIAQEAFAIIETVFCYDSDHEIVRFFHPGGVLTGISSKTGACFSREEYGRTPFYIPIEWLEMSPYDLTAFLTSIREEKKRKLEERTLEEKKKIDEKRNKQQEKRRLQKEAREKRTLVELYRKYVGKELEEVR